MRMPQGGRGPGRKPEKLWMIHPPHQAAAWPPVPRQTTEQRGLAALRCCRPRHWGRWPRRHALSRNSFLLAKEHVSGCRRFVAWQPWPAAFGPLTTLDMCISGKPTKFYAELIKTRRDEAGIWGAFSVCVCVLDASTTICHYHPNSDEDWSDTRNPFCLIWATVIPYPELGSASGSLQSWAQTQAGNPRHTFQVLLASVPSRMNQGRTPTSLAPCSQCKWNGIT